jgi:hypothetical protein
MAAAVAFDFEDVLPTVRGAHSRANRDDAEEAVQTAVAEMLERGEPLTAPFVVTKARDRLRNALRRRERGNSSLDAFAEDTEDQAPVELAIEEVDFDSHIALSDPVTEARRRAVEGNCGSCRGWTPDNVLIALQHYTRVNGQTPVYRDLAADPNLPHSNTVRRYHGTLNKALTAAGLRPRKHLIERPEWTFDEAREALRDYVADNGRLPTAVDLRNATAIGLPAQMVCYRLFGSVSQQRLAEVVYGEDGVRLRSAIAILRHPGSGQNEDLAAQLAEFCGG